MPPSLRLHALHSGGQGLQHGSVARVLVVALTGSTDSLAGLAPSGARLWRAGGSALVGVKGQTSCTATLHKVPQGTAQGLGKVLQCRQPGQREQPRHHIAGQPLRRLILEPAK